MNRVWRILIVDDDPGQRSLLESFLRSQGYATLTASSGEEALSLLQSQSVDLLISDVRMPGLSGLETLRRARQQNARIPVLLVTAYADIREAVGAMRDGALNYLPKPIDLDELLECVRQAIGQSLSEPLATPAPELPPEVVAVSPQMRAVLRDASLVAASDTRVLITGESGVGKEVVADLIHAWSPRARGPLIKINCAAIPETLLESELFGHEKGAFTGATRQRIGRFEEAHGGTLFLDEIGDMALPLQAKLLRVIQDGRFQRIGSNLDIQSNVRIIASTNRDLETAVREGRFREDLYYRLNVVELSVPPLRERPEDIVPLATHFLREFTGGRARFAPSVLELLERYPWPGNVRELRNVMERAALLCRGELVLPEHLPARLLQTAESPSGSGSGCETTRLEEVERQKILETLRRHGYNRTETARALGISRRTLVYKLQRYRQAGYMVDPPEA
ncbi:MAG: sigma-54 dependent transcriptional regulator [Verrucomicrobiota bacterium]|nr:sigma-54 dependent transcriptional regulator [Limisphaera sp.]MDW8381363.1 sigma-54 dependent transcriptional regulator [Verrucomicrobiota bacterium]